MKRLLSFLIVLLLTISCGGDDDICESGEGTPRMKITFKKADKITTLDSVKVYVDYGVRTVDLGWSRNTDSILIPLRVDESPFTDLFIKTTKKGDSSKIRVSYTARSIYVSPGCGAKLNYENVSGQLLKATPVVKVESGQNFIQNEEKTNLYLVF
ncbi:DUF6452 family protein [Chryseobacterium chendengshani]|uniref:DUF6452 family protein n=1 Tax=unclassified Chryseobacterium TaxID=2593645 RepID=UPI001C63F30B|nr:MULTISPECIES: DUF6452 family protein [unclassified Chryseobacterium]MBW7675819.1 hypothetical protein [Chryseobacterium sp. LJ756]MBW8524802.1 hypothetical protein [Chryseobacterium sp. LJ668]QYK15177.1 hypothetical protein K0U91_08755 [Chryseobacterium sp. LJ668]